MKKKTLLFFSRSELTDLYGKLDCKLNEKFHILHVAYSDVEASLLQNKYGIKDVFNFSTEYLKAIKQSEVSKDIYNEIDELFILQSDGRFNLNSSIYSDRTFKNLAYQDVISIVISYYEVWKSIFKNNKVDFFIHEPTSLMLNHIAAILCRSQGGIYSTHIMVQGEADFNFIMLDHDSGFPTELKFIYDQITAYELSVNKDRIEDFLSKFRSSYAVFFDVIGSKQDINFYFKLIRTAVKEQLLKWISSKRFDQKSENIEYFLANNFLSLKRIKNLLSYQKIKYDDHVTNEKYYFYPLHLEPEAVVLYWADGIYTNQVKLIENIAAQLPPNIFLYVKDHPHLYGYRNLADYKSLQSIPNIKLLAPQIPGKKIVKDALGVITLNGTAGFEALLLNKQIITFGSAFYNVSKRVNFVKNIKDFRKVVYDLQDVSYQDDSELQKFVLALLKSQKIGFTDFYGNVANNIAIDMDSNIENVATGLTSFFNNFNVFESKPKS